MSVADLKRYGQLAAENDEVRRQAKAIGLTNIRAQADYARTLGLDFNEDDLKALAEEVRPQGELSEEQLRRVAGGIISSTVAVAVAVAVATTTAGVAVATTAGDGW